MSKATEKTGTGRIRTPRTASTVSPRATKHTANSAIVEVRALKADPNLVPGAQVEVVAKQAGGRYILKVKDSRSGRYAAVSPIKGAVGVRRAASALGLRAMAKVAEAERQQEREEIIERVAEWAGGPDAARKWFRSFPIPAFGGRTAESMVETGSAPAVRRYLDAVAVGSYS